MKKIITVIINVLNFFSLLFFGLFVFGIIALVMPKSSFISISFESISIFLSIPILVLMKPAYALIFYISHKIFNNSELGFYFIGLFSLFIYIAVLAGTSKLLKYYLNKHTNMPQKYD